MSTRAVRAAVLLAVGVALACVPASASAQATDAQAAPETSRLWSFVDRRATEIEPLWRQHRETYVMADGGMSTRLLANMLELHAFAAIAGHLGPSRHDERIAPLVRQLTSYPAFVESSDVTPPDNQFHVPGWFANPERFPSDQHVAIDSQIAESLQSAWEARHVVALPADAQQAIRRAVGLTAWSRFFRYPSIRLNQFNWYSDLYEADAAVNGRRWLLRNDFRRQLARFLDLARRSRPGATSNLNAGLGLHYLPQFPATVGANRVSTSEYDQLIFHGIENYAAALAAGMPPFTGARARMLVDWARRALYGEWTHAGFLNWDTGLAFARWHLTRYWSFALSGLGSLAGAPVLAPAERAWARWMFDRSLIFYEAYQAGEPTPSMPSVLFGVRSSESMHENDALFVASRTAATVAQRAVQGFEDRAGTEPPPLYAYDWDIRRLALTTPSYSTAVLDQTFPGGYGGADIARLLDGMGRPLGNIGGRGHWGFGLAFVQRGGRLLLDTEPGGRAARTFHGPQIKRGAFRTSVGASARVLGRGAQVLVQYRFTPMRIIRTYRLQGPPGSSARIRLPVWARISAPARPTVTVHPGGVTVRVHQSAGAYTAIVRAAGGLRTSWREPRTRSTRSPGTAGVLDVVVPLRTGHGTVTVELRPAPAG
jgi:hypothetical protein